MGFAELSSPVVGDLVEVGVQVRQVRDGAFREVDCLIGRHVTVGVAASSSWTSVSGSHSGSVARPRNASI